MNMQEVYLKTLLGSAPVAGKGQEGSRNGWREIYFQRMSQLSARGSQKSSSIIPLCNRNLGL